MTRKPNASWVGPPREGRSSSPLQQLIAPARGLASPGPRSSVVSTPHNLPSMIPYGKVPPGQAQSSSFTGGVVQNPASLVQNQTQDFTAPSYGPLTQGSQGAYAGNMLSPIHALATLLVASGIAGGGSSLGSHDPSKPYTQSPGVSKPSSGGIVTVGGTGPRAQAGGTPRPGTSTTSQTIATLAQSGKKLGSTYRL